MSARAIRRIALAVIALLVYAQGSVALAGCTKHRGDMAQAGAVHECCDTTDVQPGPRLVNGCLSHCTADLQLFELPVTLVRAPADAVVLNVPVADADPPDPRGHSVHATPAVPPRILFQSFQI